MLSIAILNNMPEAAVRSTERQFTELLSEAAVGIPLTVTWFSFLSRDGYKPVDALWELPHVDGLIVTGTEPREVRFENEPYWPPFIRTVDWATAHTSSTIWSCLAAHAAAYHLDSIVRQPFAVKLHGVFPTEQEEHSLLANVEPHGVPHSRWNDLPLEALHGRGYQVLSIGPEVGADTFVKRCGVSLFIFFQGHREYDARALMREYRRDILRYITGERRDYPPLPLHYFDALTARSLRAFQDDALRGNADPALVAVQDAIGRANLVATWRSPAAQLYRNWFSLLLAKQTKAIGQIAL